MSEPVDLDQVNQLVRDRERLAAEIEALAKQIAAKLAPPARSTSPR